jgi:hypothetical protein
MLDGFPIERMMKMIVNRIMFLYNQYITYQMIRRLFITLTNKVEIV